MAYIAPHYNQWGSLMSGGSGVISALAAIGTLATNIVSLRRSTASSDASRRAQLGRLQRKVQELKDQVEGGNVNMSEVMKRISSIEEELERM